MPARRGGGQGDELRPVPALSHASSQLQGSPRELVKQLSVIYPCGKGQISEAGRVAAGKVILGLFTPSYGRFCFTKWRGEPSSLG